MQARACPRPGQLCLLLLATAPYSIPWHPGLTCWMLPSPAVAAAGSSDDDAFYDRTVKGAGGGGGAAAGGAKKGKAAAAAKQEVGEAPGRHAWSCAVLQALQPLAVLLSMADKTGQRRTISAHILRWRACLLP
jgi:hypothetical protein